MSDHSNGESQPKRKRSRLDNPYPINGNGLVGGGGGESSETNSTQLSNSPTSSSSSTSNDAFITSAAAVVAQPSAVEGKRRRAGMNSMGGVGSSSAQSRTPVTATRELAARYGPPDRWTYCPPMGKVVADKFLPLKTPLSACYDEFIPSLHGQYSFHPSDVFNHHPEGKRVGLWVDFTKTDRYYNRSEVEQHGCVYRKIPLEGHKSTPSREEVAEFIRVVREFFENQQSAEATDPCSTPLVAMHCTHGFNRTGFLIVAYLVEEDSYGLDVALQEFRLARPDGIYKQDYLAELTARYGDGDELDDVPVGRPAWEQGPINEEEYYFGFTPGYRPDSTLAVGSSSAMIRPVPVAVAVDPNAGSSLFMDGQVPGVVYVDNEEECKYVRDKARQYLNYRGRGFPGSQPVSLEGPQGNNNIEMLASERYMVSWKADGMRYLVLIEGDEQIYAFDRDNRVFRIPRVKFLDRNDPTHKLHLSDTLIDTEMIIEQLDGGQNMPRMLIYDIMTLRGEDVGQRPFDYRFDLIQRQLIEPRIEAMKAGRLIRERECMSVRRKDFYLAEVTHKLFDPAFIVNLRHDMDGLIFQPCSIPYIPGRCDQLLKWKPPEESTIDFKLFIRKTQRMGELPTYVGELHVLHLDTPFDYIKKVNRALLPYDQKIVECAYDKKTRDWVVKRERTDKSFPNAFKTAESVMNTIKHPVDKAHLLDFLGRHCRRWAPPGQAQRRQQ